MEQKNWTHVRKLVGWDRYDSAEALRALNALYADLRLFQNLFQPSMKLLTKVRKGSRLIRRYDRPQTPFVRVCVCPEADPKKVAALRRVLARPIRSRSRSGSTSNLNGCIAWRAGRASSPVRHPTAPRQLALARVDLQPESPAFLISLGVAHGQKPGAHRWLRSDDHQVGQGRGQGGKGSPRRRSLR